MQRLLVILLLALNCSYVAAKPIRIFGYVVDTDNRSIEAVNAYSGEGADIVGTATNKNGFYELVLDYADTISMTYSMVGYTTVRQRIIKPQEVTQINVELATDEQWLDEVEIRGQRKQVGTMDIVHGEATRMMPDATGGSIESILITFAGVNQNNELSSQYNVRGGTFDENVVYVNGLEIHRPLLYRSGQQEGLSFVNPYMVENVSFSAGGYDARYGDKMSSVLDITYKRPTTFEANLTASLLGASFYFGHGGERFSQMHGIRYKTSRYMLGATSASGNYNPSYVDYQTMMSWSLTRRKNERCTRDWRMSLLANISLNDYSFRPDSYSESWGGTDNTQTLDIFYDGQEKDRFVTAFGAIGARGHVSPEVELGFDLSGFYANERENFDITGEYVIEGAHAFGTGAYHEHARNYLQEGVITAAHSGSWKRGSNLLNWGISVQGEFITDRVSEWQRRDSAGYTVPTTSTDLQMFYALRGQSDMRTVRTQAYIQNTHEWNTNSGKWILTTGARLQYWSGNREWLPSPRASVTWYPGWKRDFAFRIATGLYYQAPFYKELRDTITDGGVTRISLNDSIRAQRSVHAVAGFDYYFRAGARPFKLSLEAYYKHIDRMESYTVENVRVQYSGRNDARGYTVGADFKIYGEMVPGADSWVSIGWMHSRMRLNDHPEYGWLPSPQEQRFNLSLFFQDYIPRFPQLRFHIKAIFAENLPFAQPRRIETIQHAKMSFYKRVDIGATYQFDRKTTRFMRRPSAKHIKQWNIGLEVFNIVGWNNVSSYFWLTDAHNNLFRSPNYLTGRRVNLKISIDFQ